MPVAFIIGIIAAALILFWIIGSAYKLGKAQHHLPGEILLEYRHHSGDISTRKATVVRLQRRPGDRPSLLTKCDGSFRSFYIHRIVALATLDGEVLDTKKFIRDRFGVPV